MYDSMVKGAIVLDTTVCIRVLDLSLVKAVIWLFPGHFWPLWKQATYFEVARPLLHYWKLTQAWNQTTMAKLSSTKSLIRTVKVPCNVFDANYVWF